MAAWEYPRRGPYLAYQRLVRWNRIQFSMRVIIIGSWHAAVDGPRDQLEMRLLAVGRVAEMFAPTRMFTQEGTRSDMVLQCYCFPVDQLVVRFQRGSQVVSLGGSSARVPTQYQEPLPSSRVGHDCQAGAYARSVMMQCAQ